MLHLVVAGISDSRNDVELLLLFSGLVLLASLLPIHELLEKWIETARVNLLLAGHNGRAEDGTGGIVILNRVCGVQFVVVYLAFEARNLAFLLADLFA